MCQLFLPSTSRHYTQSLSSFTLLLTCLRFIIRSRRLSPFSHGLTLRKIGYFCHLRPQAWPMSSDLGPWTCLPRSKYLWRTPLIDSGLPGHQKSARQASFALKCLLQPISPILHIYVVFKKDPCRESRTLSACWLHTPPASVICNFTCANDPNLNSSCSSLKARYSRASSRLHLLAKSTPSSQSLGAQATQAALSTPLARWGFAVACKPYDVGSLSRVSPEAIAGPKD